jgi:hypothetical protein
LGREARQDDGFEFTQEQVGGLVVEVLDYVPCLGLGIVRVIFTGIDEV